MATTRLYEVYRRSYDTARACGDGGRLLEVERLCLAAGLSAVERAIVQFALNDVTNGTPQRSRACFDAALEHGAAALSMLARRGRARHAA